MAEYIEREALLKKMKNWHEKISLIECVTSMPAADVAPVVHGRWVEYPRPHYFKCSECKYTVPYRKAMWCNGKREYNYCPNCGAKMNGGADNG